MTNTSLEFAQQLEHERRMVDDIEYAIQFKKDEIYSDLVNFQQFMDDYQMNGQIARELLRALCNVDLLHQTRGCMAILDALINIKSEIDAKIEFIARRQ